MAPFIRELEELLDSARLKTTRFGNTTNFLVSNGLTYKHIHAFQQRNQVSPSLFNVVLNEIASEDDRPRLSKLYTD
jgi:hypothetical protein